MIEIICKEEAEKEIREEMTEKICLPKNIRQMGSPRGRHKIYLEDYVYTYLRTMARNKEACAAVLLGKSQVVKDIRYTFISGAIECGAAVFQWERICLDESFWDYIYKEQKRYFPETEIAGWFLGKEGQAMELSPSVEAAHRKYFAGRDKVLMLLDILEEEELFFVYEQGYLQKREGYYIYYEKNLPMQEYMISKREEEQRILAELEAEALQAEEDKSFFTGQESVVTSQGEDKPASCREEADVQGPSEQLREDEKKIAKSKLEEPKTQAEEALESYRRMILERQDRGTERQNRNFLYTAASFFLVVLCVIGITTINNYRRMQDVEEALHFMDGSGASRKEQTTRQEPEDEKNEGPVVETIDSQVEPLEDSKKKDKSSETGNTSSDDENADSKDAAEPSEEENKAGTAEKTEEGGDSSADDEQAGSQETSAAGQNGEARYYTVQPGDTLDSICLAVYQSRDMLEALQEANGIQDGDKILAGQKLLLP